MLLPHGAHNMRKKLKKIYTSTPSSILCVIIVLLLIALGSRLIGLRSNLLPTAEEEYATAEPSVPVDTPEPTPTPRPVITPPPTPVPDEAKVIGTEDFNFGKDGRAFYAGDPYNVRFGIDVSEYQHEIDWKKVAADGVEFVFIRCGYRGYTKGGLKEDSYFHENMKGAAEAGLQIGVYFFSQAINNTEAVEEAEYVLELTRGYKLDLPVIYDWEIQTAKDSRTRRVSVSTATKCAVAFCERIENEGLETGIYCIGDTTQCAFKLSELEGGSCGFSWVKKPLRQIITTSSCGNIPPKAASAELKANVILICFLS